MTQVRPASDETSVPSGPTATSQIRPASSKLTTADLTAMNKRFDIDNEDADDIAADWLSDNGF